MNEGTTSVPQPPTVANGDASSDRSEPGRSGFTAVNGDSQRGSSDRSKDTSRDLTTLHDKSSAMLTSASSGAATGQYQPHGWRADSRNVLDHAADSPLDGNIDARKRKRSDSNGAAYEVGVRSDQVYRTEPESPKRRMNNHDSAIDLSSPRKPSASPALFTLENPRAEPNASIAFPRKSSPVDRSSRTKLPLPPRPEVEASLAESLAREFGNPQQTQAARVASAPFASAVASSTATPRYHGRESESPPRDEDEDHGLQDYSPEGTQGQEGFDSNKRRKRNFSNRTKTGCHTCRGRKKKCDEAKPTCQNCIRGGFVCGGYGAKSTTQKPAAPIPRHAPVALLSKRYEPSHGPTGYYENPMDDGPRYSHWGNIPTEQEQPPQSTISAHAGHRDSWPRPSWPPGLATQPYPPTSDFNQMPPIHPYPPSLSIPSPHPPIPPPIDPAWPDHPIPTLYNRPTTGHGTVGSTHNSLSNSSSRHGAPPVTGYANSARFWEKEKMLRGEPFHHFTDNILMHERHQCKAALERYNDAARTTTHISPEERGRLFRAIMEPETRPAYSVGQNTPLPVPPGPRGSVGQQVVVETPFNCDYGYNIHLGDNVVIEAGCYLQDACEITIGDRTIVGPNVKFYGLTAEVDANVRKGSQGNLRGGAIKIGEDCFIGGDVTILPFRRIGKGAVVGASSVVTKDVKEYTVVAGNPAKVIRRIEPGSNVNLHHPDIQEQNDRMLREMVEDADRRRHDR